MPDEIGPATIDLIHRACRDRGVSIAALSGTFNMIHPDSDEREAGLRRLDVLAAAAASIDIPLISLCTGTRDRENMWRHHPDNSLRAAWNDLTASIHRAIEIAEIHNIRLGIEPEPGNVVSDSMKARKLLDEIGSDRVGIILDPANLLDGADAAQIETKLEDAFALVGSRIVSAHAKDRDLGGSIVPAGKGIVPWKDFLTRLSASGFSGPLLLHGLSEQDVPVAREPLLSLLAP
ncbi:sugar phosphate isomerase/epimerase [soil metagenome]